MPESAFGGESGGNVMKLACIPSPYSQTLDEFCADNQHFLFVYHDSVFVCVGGRDATEDGIHYLVKELGKDDPSILLGSVMVTPAYLHILEEARH
jgi:hypothetical protein